MPLWSVQEWRARIGFSYCALGTWRPIKLRGCTCTNTNTSDAGGKCTRSTHYRPSSIELTSAIALWFVFNYLIVSVVILFFAWKDPVVISKSVFRKRHPLIVSSLKCVMLVFLYLKLLLLLSGDIETNPGPEMKLKELYEELAPVASKWFVFGIQAGIKVTDLYKLRRQHTYPALLLREVLTTWLERKTHVAPLWENAVNILRSPSVDERKLSDRLQDSILKEICEELAPVASDWFIFGIEAGIKVADLHKLRRQHADPAVLLREVLVVLLSLKGRKHTVSLMENAVDILCTPSMDERELSENLRVKYGLLEEGKVMPRSDILQEALKHGYVTLHITKVLVSGSAGNGKTQTKYLLFNELEKLKEARKSTPFFDDPIRALSREIVGTNQKGWHKVTYDELNKMLAQSINEGVSMDKQTPSSVTHGDKAVPKQPQESKQTTKQTQVLIGTSQLTTTHGLTESDTKHQQHNASQNPSESERLDSSLVQKLVPSSEPNSKPKATPQLEIPHTPYSEIPPKAHSESMKIERSESVLADTNRMAYDTNKANALSLAVAPSPARKEVLTHLETGKDLEQVLDLHWISFIDSGGQPQFIELLPAFVKNTSVVMMVVKLNESIETYPEIAYYKEAGALCGTKYVSHLRNDQIMQHCARTLSGEKHCRVMVVGTHKDASENLTKSINDQNHWLLDNLQRSLGSKLVLHDPPNGVLYPLNAKTPDVDDFQVADDIRRDIECDKDRHPSYKIPVAWFLLEQDMQNLNRGVITLAECYKLALSLHMTKVKVAAALEYFHKLNIVLYYPKILPNVIFVSPQVIVDKITELVAFSFELRSNAESEVVDEKWNRYKNFGEIYFKMLGEARFSKHYVSDVFTPKELVKIFTSLLIMAPLSNESVALTSRVYFMPSLLPEVVVEELDDFRPNVPFLPPAVLYFSNGCAPCGTFSRLCVYLISFHGWKCAGALYRNCIQFYIGDEPGKVTIIDAFDWFEVYLEAPQDVAFNICYNILKIIKQGVKEVSKALQEEKIAYKLAILCPNRGRDGCKSTPHAAIVSSTIQYWTCTDNPGIYGELYRKQSVWFTESIPLPGVQLIKQGILTILKSDKLQTLEWENHGLKIHVPPGALSESDKKCEITVAISLSGNFKLSDNHTLVSPVYYIQPSKKLKKPVTLELEHCCSLKTEDDTKALVPIFAQSSSKNPPYTFAPLSGGKFTVNNNWGTFDVTTFSLFGLSLQDQFGPNHVPSPNQPEATPTVPKSPPVLYSGWIYYQSICGNVAWFVIKLVVVPRIKECIEAVKQEHSQAEGWIQMTTCRNKKIIFKEGSNALTLVIGSESRNGWYIKPHYPGAPLKITKQDLDILQNNPDDPDIASCELVAKWERKDVESNSKLTDSVPDLDCEVEAQGILNFTGFPIIISPKYLSGTVKEQRQPSGTGDTTSTGTTGHPICDSDWAEICHYLRKLKKEEAQRLGGRLGLSWTTFNSIQTLPDEMVFAWLKKQDDVKEKCGDTLTWEILVKALKKIGQNGIASDITEKECT